MPRFFEPLKKFLVPFHPHEEGTPDLSVKPVVAWIDRENGVKEGITSHRSLFETIYHSNPDGLDSGKTAAHVVLYGKLKPGATAEKVRNALASQISHPDLNLQSVYAVHYPLHNVVVFGLGGRVDQEKHYDELEKEWLNGRPK